MSLTLNKKEQMSTGKKPAKKSLNKVILDAINNCFPNDLNTLANFLLAARISKDHDVIIDAWKKRTENVVLVSQEVIAAILEEKKLAEERRKKRQKGRFILS